MKLQIVRIAERGLPNKERLHLSVLQETNLSYYVVLLSRYINQNAVANGNLAAFWFPNQHVKPGDQIVLCSGSGTYTARSGPDGSTVHFFYWGQSKTVWNNPSDCAVVIEAGDWITSPQGG